jgi:hypothetical protein
MQAAFIDINILNRNLETAMLMYGSATLSLR